jgi:hypothetical protein
MPVARPALRQAVEAAIAGTRAAAAMWSSSSGDSACGTGAFDLHTRETPADSSSLAQAWRPVDRDLHRGLRRAARHVREQLPVDAMATGYAVLWNAFKRLAVGAHHKPKNPRCSAARRCVVSAVTRSQIRHPKLA